MLPGRDGLEILRQLRQEQALPVILMSALGAEQDRIAGFSQGADDYLPKPFSLAELRVRIDAILRRIALERGARRAAAPNRWRGPRCNSLPMSAMSALASGSPA